MPSFRARFEAMVAELRAHPRVEVYAVEIAAPASHDAVVQAEEAIGRPLPDELLEFYLDHDGVFLEWGLRGREYRFKTAPFDYPDYQQPPGCINLLPVAHAMTTSWEIEDHVNRIRDNHWTHLYGRVPDPLPACGSVCVDNYSKCNHADLILGPELLMVVSSDHGADMDSSDYTTFSTYLDMTLALYGTDRYAYGLGIGWTRKSERVDIWTRRPTLDQVIAELLAKG